MDSVMGTKITVLLLLAAIKLGAGLLPMFIMSRALRLRARIVDTVLAVVLCVGAGVLLSTVFIHMIPETRESLEAAAKLGYLPDPHYPFAELFMCLGFFFIYGIEVTVHSAMSSSHGGSGGSHGHSHGVPIPEITAPPKERKKSKTGGGVENGGYVADEKKKERRHSKGDHHHNHHHHYNEGSDDKNVKSKGNAAVAGPALTSYTTHDDGSDVLPKQVSRSQRRPSLARTESSKSAMEKALSKEQRILTTIRNVLVVLALSLHSVFEGMAVGLQMTSTDVWKLFAAIAIHATPILFCIGMEMTSGSTKKKHMIFYIVFVAMATPIGVTIGLIITEHVDQQSGIQTLVIGILQGMAGGTLFYITFFEVLDKEKLSKGGMNGLLGFCFIFAGFAIMAATNAMGHNHGLEGNHGHAHSVGRSGGHEGHIHVSDGHDGHNDRDEHDKHDSDYIDEIERNLAVGHDKFSRKSVGGGGAGGGRFGGHGHDGHEDHSDHTKHHGQQREAADNHSDNHAEHHDHHDHHDDEYEETGHRHQEEEGEERGGEQYHVEEEHDHDQGRHHNE